MKKHTFLSILLGLLANVLLFGQSDPTTSPNKSAPDNQNKVIIQKRIIELHGDAEDAETIDYEVIVDDLLNQEVSGASNKVIIIEDISSDEVAHILGDEAHREITRMATHFAMGDRHPPVRMGISLDDADEQILITSVDQGSPAEAAGLRSGDILKRVDREEVSSYEDVLEVLMDKAAGDRVRVDYIREGKKKRTKVTLEARHTPRWQEDCTHLNLPCLGVTYSTRTEGAKISRVFKGSGAEQAGLQSGDRITGIDGEGFLVSKQFDRLIKSKVIGQQIDLTLVRGDQTMTIPAEIGVWDQCGTCRLMTTDEKEAQDAYPSASSKTLAYDAFDMFPNPVVDQFTVNFEGQPGEITISIFDANGALLEQTTDRSNDGRWSMQYATQSWPAGTYLVTITQDGNSATKQIIVQ